MELLLTRTEKLAEYTLGQLAIDGRFFCHTLEPHAINWQTERKTPGKTAIPEGRYQLCEMWSAHFQQRMPYLQDVPYFEGVMIHPGNSVRDSCGCILVGSRFIDSASYLHSSLATFEILHRLLREALSRHEQLWLTVQ